MCKKLWIKKQNTKGQLEELCDVEPGKQEAAEAQPMQTAAALEQQHRRSDCGSACKNRRLCRLGSRTSTVLGCDEEVLCS